MTVRPADAAAETATATDDETIRICCYGDSNTWGYDAFTPCEPGALRRFGETERWPRVLAAALGPGYSVVEEALNGRTTILDDPFMNEYDCNGRAVTASSGGKLAAAPR